jgi:MAP/microtubule affinity-regulating kinase
VKELGEGGFGKVVLGKHKQTGELVAIKIIKTQKIGNA